MASGRQNNQDPTQSIEQNRFDDFERAERSMNNRRLLEQAKKVIARDNKQ